MNFCAIEFCIRPRRPKRRHCSLHEGRIYRGQPVSGPAQKIYGDFQERFWSKVLPASPEDCWTWNASLGSTGYGQFAVDGVPRKAHRVAYEQLIGEIPDGLDLDHLCRNRTCVNPWHLDPVTPAENNRRAQPFIERTPATHCKRGHAFDEPHTRITPNGRRSCRTCARMHSLASYYRRKEAS